MSFSTRLDRCQWLMIEMYLQANYYKISKLDNALKGDGAISTRSFTTPPAGGFVQDDNALAGQAAGGEHSTRTKRALNDT